MIDKARLACLAAMDITVYQANDIKPALLSWPELRKQANACVACELCKIRTTVVFGAGDQSAKLMVIGEAPGYHEDQQGQPFVGPAGQLLSAMLSSIGLARSVVYIANIIKCRPPGNRDPLPTEIQACARLLQAQIKLVQPKLLLALGKVAAQALLASNLALHQLRGKIHYLEDDVPVIVTYHPAYLLRNPIAKAKAYQDLLVIAKLYSDKSTACNNDESTGLYS